MSGKVHKRVVRNNMEVITENYEEENNSWKRKTSKKEMKKEEVIASYQSYRDGDISMQAMEATNIVTHRQHHNGVRHQYDDADESDDYSSSRSSKRSSSSSSSSSDDVALSDDDNDDNDDDNNSLDVSTASLASQTSSVEIKFEKEVDLYADNGEKALDGITNDTGVIGEYYYGEIENGLLNGPMSPVSKYGQNEMLFNSYNDQPMSPVTDNRISVMEVKQAVIETSTMDGVVQSETKNNNHEQQVLSHISDNKVSKTEVKREVTIETYTVVGVSKTNSKHEEQPLSPVSDNRVSMLEVKQAVIEASTMGGDGEAMSCEITDPGPEIKKAMMLETDIDSVAEIDANDSGDYKVVGANTEVIVETGKSAGFNTTEDVEMSNKTKPPTNAQYKYVNEKGNKSADKKTILGKKYVNNKVDAEVEKENKKNAAIIEARYAKETNATQGKGHTSSSNGETVPGTNGTQKIHAERNNSMSGLRMDQYKITEKTESITTTTTNKTETLTVVQGSSKTGGTGGSGDEIDVTLRESRGRDRSKVKRELKLDIPNNNNNINNNNKSALLDQVLLSSDMSQGIGVCCRCGEGFGTHQQIVNSNGEVWHPQCFVCAQCFQPFPDGVFYEYEGRKYCERDFHVLFAPCCAKCGEFIIGRVIKAMNKAWHPDCFRCELCNGPLADAGFVKNAGRALCRDCNAKEKARGLGKYVCHKCRSIIEEGHIKYKGEAYHPYHFNCKNCGIELNADAREVNGELYCLRCHDKMGIPICGACRRPIEERVVHALGKAWHVEHFVCAKCEKPFFGTRHYEKKGLAYCEVHYHQLFGNICFVCNTVISGDVFHAFNKAWHVKCFACSICDRKMSQKTKFFEFDLKPVCKFCYEKFPGELKKRLKKAYEEQGTKK